jgi:hypothetical protein
MIKPLSLVLCALVVSIGGALARDAADRGDRVDTNADRDQIRQEELKASESASQVATPARSAPDVPTGTKKPKK